MSKIVFFSIPAYGHTNPTIEVVRELVDRGNEVLYYSFNEFKDKIHIIETPKKGGIGLNESLDGMCKLAKALVDHEDLNPITSKYCF